MLGRGSDAVSPTAHYTGHVWVRNGLSHPELATREGRVLFEALQPTMAMSRVLGGPTLERPLLSRHRLIDERLAHAIEDGSVAQVVEVACGMSPRGWRFARRYGDRITYVEADLPAMAQRKRAALARMGSLGERHRVAELDVLREDGPGSLGALADTLDAGAGTAIVTEGLLTYLDTETVGAIWRRFASTLQRFPAGLYLSDLRLAGESVGALERGFSVALSAFVRGRVHVHFADEAEAEATLLEAGLPAATLHRGDHTHVVEARR
jgi:O-methyltransferase involved in polyketide biosynthesis